MTSCSSGGAGSAPDLDRFADLSVGSGGHPDLSAPSSDLRDGPADLSQLDGSAVPALDFRPIAPGTFKMGRADDVRCWSSVETQHDVTLTHGFEIMSTEVTQQQLRSLLGYNPAAFSTCGASCPIEQVSWHEAVAFCNELSLRKGLPPCYQCSGALDKVSCSVQAAYDGNKIYGCPGYRLPTDAEWERAYRAGTTTPFYSGPLLDCHMTDENLGRIGWYRDNAGGTPHQVGGKEPNSAGLFDMSGNVWEWCHDLWDVTPAATPVTDPVGSRPGSRVLRGGGWDSAPWFSTGSYRFGNKPESRDSQYGFRCARSL